LLTDSLLSCVVAGGATEYMSLHKIWRHLNRQEVVVARCTVERFA